MRGCAFFFFLEIAPSQVDIGHKTDHWLQASLELSTYSTIYRPDAKHSDGLQSEFVG
jgi:hypothetical protein